VRVQPFRPSRTISLEDDSTVRSPNRGRAGDAVATPIVDCGLSV
jgi:hypothetical protein